MNQRKVHVTGMGCAQTQLENVRYKNFFAANNLSVVADAAEADFVLCSTCGAWTPSENGSLQMIENVRQRMKPDALLFVTGCLPVINPEKLRKVFTGRVIPARTHEALAEIVGNPIEPFESISLAGPLPELEHYKNDMELVNPYGISSSVGCLGDCTFCSIRFSIGRLRSRPISDIVKDFETALASGYRDFVLSASDNGTYGHDIKTDIAGLLEKIIELPQDFRVVVVALNPWGFTRTIGRLVELVKSPKIWQFNVPIQHGSPRVLRHMARYYSIPRVKEHLLALRRANPALRLTLSFIVGFPGETEEDFLQSMEFMRFMDFDNVKICAFDPRPGLTIPLPPVPEDVKRERYARLRQESYFSMARRRLNRTPSAAALRSDMETKADMLQ